MSLTQAHLSLARTLPIRLQKFFCLNPPRLVNGILTAPGTTTTPVTPSPQPTTSTSTSTIPPPTHQRTNYINPFAPHKNPKTNRWHPPLYSLRRQAELVKLAKQHGVEDLLPPSQKSTEERERRRIEYGLRVKGTGAGQKVKGHEWERTLKGRLQKRRTAMLEMPALVQAWKQRGHGRGWSKWPSGKAGRD